MKTLLRLFVALFVAVAAATPVTRAAAEALGPLASVIDPGVEGAWTTTIDSAGVALVNTTDDKAIRYNWARAPGSRYRIEATVSLDVPVGRFGAAGLLLAFDPDTGHYLAAVASPDGRFALLVRDARGLRPMISSQLPEGGRAKGERAFVAIVAGNRVTVRLDGQDVGSIENALVARGRGGGIVAMGLGTFRFARFAVDPRN